MSSFDDKLNQLSIDQITTHTLLGTLIEKVDNYINLDNERHYDLSEFRLESSKHLVEVASIVQDLKKDVDRLNNTTIPILAQKQSCTETKLKNHSWLIKALVTVTIMATLGGIVGGVTQCSTVDSGITTVVPPLVSTGDR